ncbi:MAG TPA: decaprenyl-phosphate phosphoribosyltransferase [Kofleriaceae bacterium]|jgi:4-hydroxybenzoate polyprenyltransferase
MSPAVALWKTVRPHQWVKNVFVAAPLVFSRHLTNPTYIVRTAVAVLAFCLLAGAVYCFNDVRDVEADRSHPKKRERPIAAGHLSERAALIAAAILAVLAIAGCLVLSWKLAVVAAIYGIQNVAYSLKLKEVAFLDVAMIAFGFVLRVLAGAYAIAVPASEWLIACTALLALLLGFGKRAHELAWALKNGSTKTRGALAGYRLLPLKISMYVLAIATCVAYVAYARDPHTIEMFGTDRIVFSAPEVALAIIRFIAIATNSDVDESPTEAMLKDPLFIAILVAAAGTILYAIYGRHS